jgi:competence protein ComGC
LKEERAAKDLSKDMCKRSGKKGVTLIEMVLILAVVAVLATMLAITVSHSVRRGNDAKRLADMKVLIAAFEFFYNDHGRYPNNSDDGIPNSGQVVGLSLAIDTVLGSYVEGLVPQDPIMDAVQPVNAGYYYAYDPLHNVDWCSGALDGVWPVLGFNRAQLEGTILHKDTCMGADMGLHNADYNVAFSD